MVGCAVVARCCILPRMQTFRNLADLPVFFRFESVRNEGARRIGQRVSHPVRSRVSSHYLCSCGPHFSRYHLAISALIKQLCRRIARGYSSFAIKILDACITEKPVTEIWDDLTVR